MHVTGVDTFIVRSTAISSWVLLKVRTDEGLDGWGECTLEGKELTVLGAIHELSRTLVGQDPLPIELRWNEWLRTAAWKGAALYSAMSGLEHALWDLKGKALGVPVYELLGGAVRADVQMYTWLDPFLAAEALSADIALAHDRYGLQHFKLDPFGPSYFTASPTDLAAATDRLGTVIAQVRPGSRIAVDAHQRFLPGAAITVIQALAEHGPLFVEEPVLAEDLDGLERVRAATSVPLAWGERCFTRWGATQVLARRLVDYLQIDLCHVGGIWEARKVAAMAEAFGVQVVPHNPNGPISLAASLHLAAASPNVVALETVHTRLPLISSLVAEPFSVAGGRMAVPAGPGLGVTVDEDALVAQAMEPVDFPFPPESVVPSGF